MRGHVAPRVGVLVLALLGATVSPAASRTFHVLVYLADFADVPHPTGYSREFVADLFFGLGSPRRTPEGRSLSSSLREYFRELSEGRIELVGEVAEWVRLPRQITRVPHWKSGIKPFGESWPVVVAETLRAHHLVGADAVRGLRLSDGRRPDFLVFLNTDWGSGGVNRGWSNLRDILGRMKLGELWDDAWTGLPAPFSSFSLTTWRKAPPTADDGTIDRVPPAAELELFPLSVMAHELGHQLAGWPDLYTPAYAPWGVFDLMGGPARTHHVMSVGSYLRVRSAWMKYTDLPPQTRDDLVLRPLETHREAFRFAQGPGQETIVAENRWELRYPRSYSDPPTNQGPRLLFYHLDPAGRRRIAADGRVTGRVTTVIRRPESYGELWGPPGFAALTAQTSPTSRNALGELWWEFTGIAPQADGTVRFAATRRARDLAADQAGWTALPDGPQRLYLLVNGTATDELRLAAGDQQMLTAPLAAGQPCALVADLPTAAAQLELTTASGAPPDIATAWLVGLPRTHTDLLTTMATWSPAAPTTGPARLADGATYGPATLRLPLTGTATNWQAAWSLALPPTPAVLRAVVGLGQATPRASRVAVSLRLRVGTTDHKLLPNLELTPGKDEPPAVLEVDVPPAAQGETGRLTLQVTAAAGAGGELVLPCLRLTAP